MYTPVVLGNGTTQIRAAFRSVDTISTPANRSLHLIRDRRRRVLVELGVYAKSHTPADILYGSDDPDTVML